MIGKCDRCSETKSLRVHGHTALCRQCEEQAVVVEARHYSLRGKEVEAFDRLVIVAAGYEPGVNLDIWHSALGVSALAYTKAYKLRVEDDLQQQFSSGLDAFEAELGHQVPTTKPPEEVRKDRIVWLSTS